MYVTSVQSNNNPAFTSVYPVKVFLDGEKTLVNGKEHFIKGTQITDEKSIKSCLRKLRKLILDFQPKVDAKIERTDIKTTALEKTGKTADKTISAARNKKLTPLQEQYAQVDTDILGENILDKTYGQKRHHYMMFIFEKSSKNPPNVRGTLLVTGYQAKKLDDIGLWKRSQMNMGKYIDGMEKSIKAAGKEYHDTISSFFDGAENSLKVNDRRVGMHLHIASNNKGRYNVHKAAVEGISFHYIA
jgi:hypothetical protein